MTPTPDPIQAATAYLRHMLAIAQNEGWVVQAACIQRVIERVSNSTF